MSDLVKSIEKQIEVDKELINVLPKAEIKKRRCSQEQRRFLRHLMLRSRACRAGGTCFSCKPPHRAG